MDEPLTATDMRMRENDVTLGIPKTSYKCSAVQHRKSKLLVKKFYRHHMLSPLYLSHNSVFTEIYFMKPSAKIA